MQTITLLTFLFISNNLFAQNSNRIYKIYEFGMFFNVGDSCSDALGKKYGFRRDYGGCIIQYRHIKRNEKTEAKLAIRNGQNWREMYDTEWNNCSGVSNIQLNKINDTTPRFIVDGYPVTDSMFNLCFDKLAADELISYDKVWFTNATLNQTLIFEIYTDHFRMITFHIINDDIPAELLKRMELHNAFGDFATEENKSSGVLALQKLATPIAQNYFTTNKGFVLGDKKVKAIDIYGKPDTISVLDDLEKLQWKFIGDIYYYDHKIDLKGKPVAEHSFGHTITMFFRDDKLIGLILENEIP
jgi:hypothetical protein